MATSVIKKRSPLRRALTDSPKSPKLTPRSGSGPNTKPVGPRPQTHVDRGPMRKPPGDSKLRAQVKKLEDAVGKRPRSAILANRKKRVLAAIDRMKADTGKTEAEREFSWKTQERLTQEARNRGWLDGAPSSRPKPKPAPQATAVVASRKRRRKRGKLHDGVYRGKGWGPSDGPQRA